MKIWFSLLLCFVVPFAYGSVVRDVSIHSPSMDKEVPASVILTDSYDVDKATRWPVIYVLHGAGGTHRWYIDAEAGEDVWRLDSAADDGG